MNVKPLSTLQRVLTAGLAQARLECALSAACPRLLLITLKFLHAEEVTMRGTGAVGAGAGAEAAVGRIGVGSGEAGKQGGTDAAAVSRTYGTE